jgi:hypothetical protein
MSDTPPAPPTQPPPTPSTPPPAPPPSADPSASSTNATEPETDWKAEARKWETRAKENSKAVTELDKLKAKTMSETEKAVAEAEARGRTAAVTDFGSRLAAAEIKAALTGVVSDPNVIVEDLNLARYLTDDGEVDSKAVAALRKKYEALLKPPSAPADPKGRPAENLRKVPVAGGDTGPMTDMSAWMRDRSRGASQRT